MKQDQATELKSERSRLRRAHERGSYDRETLYSVLDAMPMAHISYVIDGRPSVLPTLQWREGDHIYWHGSSASRALRAMAGKDVCLSVTLMDGYVLARSAMHHSVNFRSAMVFGVAEKVAGEAAKAVHLERMVEGLFPGRWQGLRPVSDQELKATAVMRMPLEEAAAKIRSGGPNDDEEDYALPIWAGVVPMQMALQPVEADMRNLEGVGEPAHLNRIRIG